jgi:5-methylcytosine-specific restriction enzyme A
MARLKMLRPRLEASRSSRVRTLEPHNPDSWRAGKTTAERGYGGRWQRLSKRYLREHPLCVHCQDEGEINLATLVDHIEPHRGDEALFWDESNWQPLCARHHAIKTQAEERASLGRGPGGAVESSERSRP